MKKRRFALWAKIDFDEIIEIDEDMTPTELECYLQEQLDGRMGNGDSGFRELDLEDE